MFDLRTPPPSPRPWLSQQPERSHISLPASSSSAGWVAGIQMARGRELAKVVAVGVGLGLEILALGPAHRGCSESILAQVGEKTHLGYTRSL